MNSKLVTALWNRYGRAFTRGSVTSKKLRAKLADEVRITDHCHHSNSFCCTPRGLALRFDPQRLEPVQQSKLRCADCNCIIDGNPNLAGDLGHDDDYGPVPTVTICDDCLEDRRR